MADVERSLVGRNLMANAWPPDTEISYIVFELDYMTYQ